MAKFYVDEKVTIWQRHTFGPNVTKEQVIEHLKSGGSLYDLMGEGDSKYLHETFSELTPAENGGAATIELWEEGDVIYRNGES